ncbi:MAG: ATP-dependent DNA ligase [Candidatus Bathyarchaeia archaeon]|nr:ATP-dependent DNA ligase [Candidatus Bathyarchaeota archaeon]
MKFKSLVELCEKLEKTTRRNLMVSLVSDFLKGLSEEEIEPAVSMMLGRAFPKYDTRTLNVSWTTLSRVISRLAGSHWSAFHQAFRATGDVGAAVQAVFERRRAANKQATLLESPLTILEVRKIFEGISEARGEGSREKKERLLEALFSRATPSEAKYLTKIIIGEMRTGFQEGLMENAVAEAFSIPLRDVQLASMVTGDISEVAYLCKKYGKSGVINLGFKIFRPIKPMLAQMAASLKEVFEEHGGKTALEYKLDGARVQIHMSNGEIRIFSRRLTDVTRSLPEIVGLIRDELRAREAILEGEVIAVGEDSKPMPFQHLMRRFKRVHEIDKIAESIPVELYLFDVLYLNGESMIGKQYVERREILRDIAGSIPLTKQMITSSLSEAEAFLKAAVEEGHEGLMAKRLDSPYMPGVRGRHWFKIKETLPPLDLVIVAAEYGYGRRHGWLSDYYLAARDGDGFTIVGKTFKGLTDEEISEMTRRLKKIVIKEEDNKVIVLPKIVVEVAYNEIQRSPKYESGMALRFARIIRIRDDKGPEEADTIEVVRRIYESQFYKKSRFYGEE